MGLYFHTPQLGWAVGSGGTILKTVDGGKKWKKVVSGTTASLSAVFFFDEKQGWAVGANGTIRRSQDGGNTWHQQLVDTQVALYGLSFVSPSEGWVVGGNGTILHTKDGGTHWVDQASKTSAALYGVQFLTAQHGTVGWGGGDRLDDGRWRDHLDPARDAGSCHAVRCVFFRCVDRVGWSGTPAPSSKRPMAVINGSIARYPARAPVRS